MKIYVHIPFCEHKCKYCSFASSVCSERTQTAYFFALTNEITRAASLLKKEKITSIYIGGGTPSVVDKHHITNLVQLLESNFEIAKDAEITIEANPNTASPEKLAAYKSAGVNRISFGAQSFDNQTLQTLGRMHNASQVFEAVEDARKAGFENISIDLILGVKKFENLDENIKQLARTGLTHISAYMLILEGNTPLKIEVDTGKTKVLTDDESVEEYEHAYKVFKTNGFERYETSNFAKTGFESRHNMGYWQMEEYIGFGLAAHSYLDGKRFSNTENLNEYLNIFGNENKIEKNKKINKTNKKIIKNTKKIDFFNKKREKNINFDYFLIKPLKNQTQKITSKKFDFRGKTVFDFSKIFEQLSPAQTFEEYIMLGLRTAKGIDLNRLKRLGLDLKKERAKEIETLISAGALTLENDFLKLTPAFYGVQNQVILKLI